MDFQLIWTNFWLNIAEDNKKRNNMAIEDNVSTINSKNQMLMSRSLNLYFQKLKQNRYFSVFESIMVRIAEVNKEN